MEGLVADLPVALGAHGAGDDLLLRHLLQGQYVVAGAAEEVGVAQGAHLLAHRGLADGQAEGAQGQVALHGDGLALPGADVAVGDGLGAPAGSRVGRRGRRGGAAPVAGVVAAFPARQQVEHEHRADRHRRHRPGHRQRHRAAEPAAPAALAGPGGGGRDRDGEPAGRTVALARGRYSGAGRRRYRCRRGQGCGRRRGRRRGRGRGHHRRRPEDTGGRSTGRIGPVRPLGRTARLRRLRRDRRPAEPHRARRPARRPARRLPGRLQVQQPYGAPADPFHQRSRQPPAGDQAGRALGGEAPGDLAGGRAGGRVLGQARGDQLPQLPVEGAERRLLVDDLVEQGGRGVPGEGRLARGRVRQDRAQREDVRRARDALAEDLLRGHVAGGADRDARRGQGRGAVRGAGDAEVDEEGPVEGEQDVGRFHVPVDEAQVVHGRQRLAQTGAERAHRAVRQRAAVRDRGGEGGAGGVGRGDPRDAGVRVRVEHGGRPGAADPPRGVHLAPEAGAELLVQREVRVHDLHGDRAAAGAAAEVDPAHAAGAQPAEQPVGPHGRGLVDVERLHGVHPSPVGRYLPAG